MKALELVGYSIRSVLGPRRQGDVEEEIKKSLDDLKQQNFSLLDSQRRLQDVFVSVLIKLSNNSSSTSGDQQSRSEQPSGSTRSGVYESNQDDEVIILPGKGESSVVLDRATIQSDPILRGIAEEMEHVANVVNEQHETLSRLGAILEDHTRDTTTAFSETKLEFHEIRERDKASSIQQVWVSLVISVIFLIAGWLLSELVHPASIISLLGH